MKGDEGVTYDFWVFFFNRVCPYYLFSVLKNKYLTFIFSSPNWDVSLTPLSYIQKNLCCCIANFYPIFHPNPSFLVPNIYWTLPALATAFCVTNDMITKLLWCVCLIFNICKMWRVILILQDSSSIIGHDGTALTQGQIHYEFCSLDCKRCQ